MFRRLCGRRRSARNIIVFLLFIAFFYSSFMISNRLDESMFNSNLKRVSNVKRGDNEQQKESDAGGDESKVNSVDENERHVVNNEKWFRKPYSPNAVFKEGVLGNYEPKLDMSRTGPGEYGVAVGSPPGEKEEVEKVSREYGFNMVNSDRISLDRVINDLREDECKYWHYPENLPTASVILVVFNEGWSTLLRTVHSVINMSPPQLLHEVVIVDDCSDKEHLFKPLEDHVAQFGKKVKIVRNKEREGLIKSRNYGAFAATGDVLIFLDAHCECSPNWLPPLLTRIAYDRTIMAAPIVDSIDWSTFVVRGSYGDQLYRGIFEWGFFYKEMKVPQKERDKRIHHSEPYWSPTNAGGLFAIDREYFLLLGAYDHEFVLWGGENFELAFKLWQCGGSSEWVPCSRVGHIYRHHVPDRKFKVTTKLSPSLINYLRFVEVWLDGEYKEYFYRREPQTRGYPVNVTKQVQFKKDNQCQDFKWLMDNVAYDVFDRFPPPVPNKAWGKIKSRKSKRCLEYVTQYNGRTALGSYDCNYVHSTFRLNTLGQIGTGERCIKATKDDNAITEEWCSTTDQSGDWDWNREPGRLYNKKQDKCVAVKEDGGVHLLPCDDSIEQQFDIEEWYPWK